MRITVLASLFKNAICIFLFRSYSFGIETINTFIHSRSSPENHTRVQTKMGKVYTRFQTKIDCEQSLIFLCKVIVTARET